MVAVHVVDGTALVTRNIEPEFPQHTNAQYDTLVADKHRRPSKQLRDLAFRSSTEGAGLLIRFFACSPRSKQLP